MITAEDVRDKVYKAQSFDERQFDEFLVTSIIPNFLLCNNNLEITISENTITEHPLFATRSFSEIADEFERRGFKFARNGFQTFRIEIPPRGKWTWRSVLTGHGA